MPGLVNGKLRAVRQADCCEKPPALIGDIPGHFGSLAFQLGEGGLNVVTHEVELVMARTVSRVNSKLGRGQSENEPASARVYRRHAYHVCEERADLLSFRRKHDRMYSGDHAAIVAAGTVKIPYRPESRPGRTARPMPRSRGGYGGASIHAVGTGARPGRSPPLVWPPQAKPRDCSVRAAGGMPAAVAAV